jgi:hypothetical protein
MPPLNKDPENTDFWLYNEEAPEPRSEKLPLQEQDAARCRSVQFHPHAMRYEIPSLDAYTEEEINDSWYNKSDYSDFSQDILHTIHLMVHSPTQIDNVEYTIRGSESRIPFVARNRKQVRREGRALVFNAKQQCCKDDWIAWVYSQFSNASLQEALVQGMTDEQEVIAIQEKDRQQQWENFFNDDWIRSGSTNDTDPMLSSLLESDIVDISGFDDQWLELALVV